MSDTHISAVRKDLPLNKFGDRRGMHPHSRINMSKKGTSNSHRPGSPISLVGLLKTELCKIPNRLPDGKINTEKKVKAQLLVEILVDEALDGNVTLIRDILDRVDGKPIQSVSGTIGGSVEIKQDVKIVSSEDLKPVLEALIGCGAITVCSN